MAYWKPALEDAISINPIDAQLLMTPEQAAAEYKQGYQRGYSAPLFFQRHRPNPFYKYSEGFAAGAQDAGMGGVPQWPPAPNGLMERIAECDCPPDVKIKVVCEATSLNRRQRAAVSETCPHVRLFLQQTRFLV
jgi:hypothetical protein